MACSNTTIYTINTTIGTRVELDPFDDMQIAGETSQHACALACVLTWTLPCVQTHAHMHIHMCIGNCAPLNDTHDLQLQVAIAVVSAIEAKIGMSTYVSTAYAQAHACNHAWPFTCLTRVRIHICTQMSIGAHTKLEPADNIGGYRAPLHCDAFQLSVPLAGQLLGSSPYFLDLGHQYP